MNFIFSIIIVGVLIYLLLKFCLYLYRPFYLSKIIRKTDKMYKKVLSHTEREVDSALEDLKKWQSGDNVHRILGSEEEALERVKAAELAKAHEEEVYRKFLRLKERFIQDYIKLADSVTTYQRYLEVRLNQIQNGALFASGVTSGAISFEEMVASRNETFIILEENERKLDRFLTD